MRIITSFLIVLILVVVAFPLPAQAACVPGSAQAPSGSPTDFKDFVCYVNNFIGLLTPLLVAVSLLVFFWGIARFVLAAGDEKKVEEGKKLLIWGTIGLFVVTSLWGILQILSGSLFGSSPIGVPLLPTNTP